LNEKAQVTFPDDTEISCVILGEDELGNYKCSALESNGKYKQGDIFYCNEDTHEIVKTAKLTKLSGLKNLLSNEIKKYQWGFDNHKSPWKYNKITGMIEKDPEAVKKLAKLLKTAMGIDHAPDVYDEGFQPSTYVKVNNANEIVSFYDKNYPDFDLQFVDFNKVDVESFPEDMTLEEAREHVESTDYQLHWRNSRGIKSLSKLLKTSLQSGDEYWDNEDYGQTPRKEVRYAVEADFYVYATSDEEAFQQADAVKEVLEDKELPEVLKISDFEIKNIYKIPTGTINFDNKPLQRQSKLSGLKFLLSHALDPKIETKFDNSLKAVKYHLFQYSGNDDVKELQTVADYLNDLLMVTKEQIANHHTDERPEFKGSHSSEQATFNAMQGGTD